MNVREYKTKRAAWLKEFWALNKREPKLPKLAFMNRGVKYRVSPAGNWIGVNSKMVNEWFYYRNYPETEFLERFQADVRLSKKNLKLLQDWLGDEA